MSAFALGASLGQQTLNFTCRHNLAKSAEGSRARNPFLAFSQFPFRADNCQIRRDSGADRELPRDLTCAFKTAHFSPARVRMEIPADGVRSR